MALELRQQLKMSQQLVMTPQLQQAIKLLQLSRVELLETIQQELLENPFLEESYDEYDPLSEHEIDTRGENQEDIYAQEISHNADWEDYLGEFSSSTKQASVKEYESLEDESLGYDARHVATLSLAGHLMWQLRLSHLSEKEKRVGEIIIDNLNRLGYLEATDEDLSTLSGASHEEIEHVRHLIQRFDPVGVASRTAQECLLTQLEVANYAYDPVLWGLITDHLEDLETKRYKPLMKKFKLNFEDLREYLEVLQSLDPFPGANYGEEASRYISPDVYVYPSGDDFIIILNEDGLPQLQLSSLYDDALVSSSSQDKEYLQERMRSASWLIRSLHQRQRTLYKVTESIVKHQRLFFSQGTAYLKPLILRDIAEDISMHESTVSRITTSKYVATPFGIFELKYFFNSALSLDDGSEVGSESVKTFIKKYIDNEDSKSPLSDEQIAEALKEELKINIARRTIAKYRSVLNIPSSSKRKVLF